MTTRSCLIIAILLPVLLAVLVASSLGDSNALLDLLSGKVETPPPDFGSGQMFDQIAGRYDFINRVLALRMDVSWRSQMTQRVNNMLPSQSSNYHILDMATGTADVAMQLSRDLPANTKILGLDPSNNMLSVGRQKIANAGLSDQITLEQADARDLSEYNSNAFDAATMSFGIRNVPNPRSKALCEIHRLLKPNGILGILEFSKPDDTHGVLGKVARVFITHVVPLVGGILSGKPREYLHLQNSIKDFPSPSDFQQLLQTLQCPGYFDMEPIQHLNFGCVQLYVGRAVKPAVEDQPPKIKADPTLPPLKAAATEEGQ